MVLEFIDMHNDTVASISLESCTNTSCRKSTMNSISRKYPLVILSPNKDLLYGSTNGESTGKSICEPQIVSVVLFHYLCICNYIYVYLCLSIQESKKCVRKKTPDICSLAEEADAKWEMIKKSKLKSSSISVQNLNIPLVDVKYQQQRQSRIIYCH